MHQKTLKSVLRNSVKHFQKCSQQVMRTLEGPTSLPWTLTPVIVHPWPRSHTLCPSNTMTGYSKRLRAWSEQGSSPKVSHHGPVQLLSSPKKSAPGKAPRRRMCIDFCTINALQPKVVKADSKVKGNLTLHPLPNIDQLYAKLRGAKVYSTLDLRSGYYHIELGKGSHTKTAFVTPFGKYEFNMVPFGLAQAPTYFHMLISKVLKGLHSFTMAYLDDIIIFSKDEEEHLEHLRIIFQHLKEAGLKLKRSKCDFIKRHIQYLGHLISQDRIQPLLEKLESIRDMPAPRNPKEIKQFLGLAGYYCKFVPRFLDLSRPLTWLTHKDVLFEWTKECQAVFQMLKDALCEHPILRYLDPTKPYVLFMDASKYAWAGVLTQAYDTVMS